MEAATATAAPPPTATPESDSAPEPDTEKVKKERTPTLYVALIEHDGVFNGVENDNGELRTFEAYRRDEVLQELIDDKTLAFGENGKTAWVRITPVRGFQRLRGSEAPPTPPKVLTETG